MHEGDLAGAGGLLARKRGSTIVLRTDLERLGDVLGVPDLAQGLDSLIDESSDMFVLLCISNGIGLRLYGLGGNGERRLLASLVDVPHGTNVGCGGCG